MNIVISGYGRMGKLIHETALNRSHTVVAVVDKNEDWNIHLEEIKGAEVVIDFSLPGSVLENIERCFNLNIPLVVGTTGWYDKIDEIKKMCLEKKQSFFYAPNFSIGVNVFFQVNNFLADLMKGFLQYDVYLKEVHHTNKIDLSLYNLFEFR